MDDNNAAPAGGGANDPAFYTMKVARDFGAQIARQYKAGSPTHLVSAFVEGLTVDGDVVSIGQLLDNGEVTKWLTGIGATERQLRTAIKAARDARRVQASAATGIVMPPRRRRRPSDKQMLGN